MQDLPINQVDALRRVVAVSRHATIRLDFPGISETERLEFEKKLNSLRKECGCKMGSRFAAASFVFFSMLALVAHHREVIKWWSAVAVVFGAVFFSAGAGKVFGILRARRKIAELLTEVEQAVECEEEV